MLIRYLTGAGATQANTSARISDIEDVRAHAAYAATWHFTYNSDYPVPHLADIANYTGTAEKYSFSYQGQNLYSPFLGEAYGTTSLLSRATISGINIWHDFVYNSSGELTQAVLPLGATLGWAYTMYPYAGNRSIRGVQTRTFAPSAGATQTTHTVSMSLTGAEHVPALSCITPSVPGQRCWSFVTDTASPYIGLESSHDERLASGGAVARVSTNTWTQDAAGTPYIASVVTTVDPGTAYTVQSKMEQTLDTHGNVLQSKVYGYGNLTTPARTYTNTYLASNPTYAARFIYNRLVTSDVNDGSRTVRLVLNVYDQLFCLGYYTSPYDPTLGNPSMLRQFDVSAMSSQYPGNVNGVQRPEGWRCLARDIAGTVHRDFDAISSTTIETTASTNFAAPSVVAPNGNSNLGESITYSSFLGLSSLTAPNSATSTAVYDGYARPTQTTSPHGAVTTYTYTNSPPTQTAVTNGRWVKTTLDGIGRTVKVESGDGAPSSPVTRSIVDTEYAPCACSPNGKLWRVSLPYAPGTPPDQRKWASVYTYDGLGRTVSVATRNGQGVTTYVYQGNTVTITDPAYRWKKQTSDVFGNLIQVTEPDPNGGANLETYYTYNFRDKLTTVTMPRGTVTQTRTFVYDDAGRLTQATNPESGTLTYTYNADSTVASRRDQKNQVIKYTYDAYKRLTALRGYYYLNYPDGTSVEMQAGSTSYYYDTNPFEPAVSENAWGRLAAVQYAAGIPITLPDSQHPRAPSFLESYGYTPAGKMTIKRMVISEDAVNTANLEHQYSYDNEGRTISMRRPLNSVYDGHAVYETYTYGYDGMGRPNHLSYNLNDFSNTTRDIVTSATYGAAGELKELRSGSSGQNLQTRTYDSAMQLTRIQTQAVDFRYTYPATQNDGRILSYTEKMGYDPEVTYNYSSRRRTHRRLSTLTSR